MQSLAPPLKKLEGTRKLTWTDGFTIFSFYTLLKDDGRTFCILPNEATLPNAYVQASSHYSSNQDNRAKNEIEA